MWRVHFYICRLALSGAVLKEQERAAEPSLSPMATVGAGRESLGKATAALSSPTKTSLVRRLRNSQVLTCHVTRRSRGWRPAAIAMQEGYADWHRKRQAENRQSVRIKAHRTSVSNVFERLSSSQHKRYVFGKHMHVEGLPFIAPCFFPHRAGHPRSHTRESGYRQEEARPFRCSSL